MEYKPLISGTVKLQRGGLKSCPLLIGVRTLSWLEDFANAAAMDLFGADIKVTIDHFDNAADDVLCINFFLEDPLKKLPNPMGYLICISMVYGFVAETIYMMVVAAKDLALDQLLATLLAAKGLKVNAIHNKEPYVKLRKKLEGIIVQGKGTPAHLNVIEPNNCPLPENNNGGCSTNFTSTSGGGNDLGEGMSNQGQEHEKPANGPLFRGESNKAVRHQRIPILLLRFPKQSDRPCKIKRNGRIRLAKLTEKSLKTVHDDPGIFRSRVVTVFVDPRFPDLLSFIQPDELKDEREPS